MLRSYYDEVPGLIGGFEGALRNGRKVFNASCALVTSCDLEFPDIDLHIGSGTARIHGNMMTGRRIGNEAHPLQQNGKFHDLSLSLV